MKYAAMTAICAAVACMFIAGCEREIQPARLTLGAEIPTASAPVLQDGVNVREACISGFKYLFVTYYNGGLSVLQERSDNQRGGIPCP